jgi:hypothetical protein
MLATADLLGYRLLYWLPESKGADLGRENSAPFKRFISSRYFGGLVPGSRCWLQCGSFGEWNDNTNCTGCNIGQHARASHGLKINERYVGTVAESPPPASGSPGPNFSQDVTSVLVLDECLVGETCIDRFLWVTLSTGAQSRRS